MTLVKLNFLVKENISFSFICWILILFLELESNSSELIFIIFNSLFCLAINSL